ncbi:ThiF family adenylyltransferase [Amycolatopsis sp. NPDC004169]|uniref:ThiF family adenylyltransferase n=1 Tax=Amycolatopsis sp. NPDC004169 TaxID=3154453 RepID=UPI0033AF5CE9
MTFDDERIRHLTGDSERTSRILIVGLGSGGFPVLQHIAMSGWRRFALVDPDTLDAKNLVKHPALRSDIGRHKVDIAADWLADRIPGCEVETYRQPIEEIDGHQLRRLTEESDYVVSATDSNAVRHFVNDLCITTTSPMSLGLVHRGGTGGTVLTYRPESTGCYACLESVAEGLDGLPSDTDLPVTGLEQEMVYGRGLKDYAAAGLSADIGLVAALHAQLTVAELLTLETGGTANLPQLEASWLAVRIRFPDTWNWHVDEIRLPPIDGCVSCGKSVAPAATRNSA